MKKFDRLIAWSVQEGFSDLHITGGHPIVYRKHGVIRFEKTEAWSHDEVDTLVSLLLNQRQLQTLRNRLSVDFAVSVSHVRVRVNVFNTTRGLSMAVRVLPGSAPSISGLNLHPSIQSICQVKAGLVLICGSTGSGKSATIAAMIEEINRNSAMHIVTLEDPIEYRFVSKKSFVEQRELGEHIVSIEQGLLDVLREDPDVIVVGELRDPETIRLALNAAESGHLVIATLHGSNSEEALYRIFNSFPPIAQESVRTQLASTLTWLVVQRLDYLHRAGFRVPYLSILKGTPAIKSLIRDNKLAQIENAMQTGRGDGMFTMSAYAKDHIDRLTSFCSPSDIFRPSFEATPEPVYRSILLNTD
ncbi:MAG: PilT/PilU family type 4a pilus ATPase [Syntrophobacteraceae bacterium]